MILVHVYPKLNKLFVNHQIKAQRVHQQHFDGNSLGDAFLLQNMHLCRKSLFLFSIYYEVICEGVFKFGQII